MKTIIENYDREERIAIRQDSHMSEDEAIKLTAAEYDRVECLADRIAKIAKMQSAKPDSFRIKKRFDTAKIISGDME